VDSRRRSLAFTAGDASKLAKTPVTSDAAFLRRIYLDLIGLPPSADEVAAFLADSSPDKRTKLIDRLLADERGADHAMSEWLDALAENPTLINASLNSTGPFRWFLLDSLRDHKPLDRMVTELLMMRGDAAHGGSAGFAQAGENDAPFATKGHIIASAFLGVELQCARCHDSPYHSTKQRDLYSLAAMLERKTVTVPKTSRVPAAFFEKKARESLIRVTLKPDEPVTPVWPFAEVTGAAENAGLDALVEDPKDTRERIAALITSPENRRFPRVIVNRLWKRLMGAGFVEPVQDWEGHDASHPELLDWLANELLNANYDVRHIIRLIVTSQAYQREAGIENLASAGPEERFFHAPARRRLTAEQIVDSLHVAAGAAIDSEPMTFVHDGSKTLQNRQDLGLPRRAWMFASLNNERDRPSLALPRAQAVVNVLEAFGWNGARQKPVFARESESNVLQPGILENGILTQSLSRAFWKSKLADLAVEAKSPEGIAGAVCFSAFSAASRNLPSGNHSCRICAQALKHDSRRRMKSWNPLRRNRSASSLGSTTSFPTPTPSSKRSKTECKKAPPRSATATRMAGSLRGHRLEPHHPSRLRLDALKEQAVELKYRIRNQKILLPPFYCLKSSHHAHPPHTQPASHHRC
jgi:hypothetical protein